MTWTAAAGDRGRGPRTSLIERAAPHPDAAERHEIEVRAPSDVVYRTLWTADLGGSWVVRGLLALRSVPAALRGRGRSRAARALTLRGALAAGFGVLAEKPGRELLLGVTGKFWRPTGNVEPFDPASFERPVPPGMARGWWSFEIVPAGERTVLSTETRVACGDAASRRKFRLYWTLIRAFSGLIRVLMLAALRDAAEAAAAEAHGRSWSPGPTYSVCPTCAALSHIAPSRHTTQSAPHTVPPTGVRSPRPDIAATGANATDTRGAVHSGVPSFPR